MKETVYNQYYLSIFLRNMRVGYMIEEFRGEICNLLFIDD